MGENFSLYVENLDKRGNLTDGDKEERGKSGCRYKEMECEGKREIKLKKGDFLIIKLKTAL